MADTRRSLSSLQSLLADNTVGAISPQDLRDMLASLAPPYGTMYLTTPAATTVSAGSTWYKAAGTTAATNVNEFSMAANNRLTYTGTPDIHVHVAVSLSFTSASNNQLIGIRVGKNGAVTATDCVASEVRRQVGTGADEGSTALHFDTMMSTNDYLELFIQNETGGSNVTVQKMYFFVLGMLV